MNSLMFRQVWRVSGAATGTRCFTGSAGRPQTAPAAAAQYGDGEGGGALASGLNFTVTPEQQEYLDLADQFTKNEIIPQAAHYDQTGEYPWPILRKAHETGLMNLHIPEEYGGMVSSLESYSKLNNTIQFFAIVS